MGKTHLKVIAALLCLLSLPGCQPRQQQPGLLRVGMAQMPITLDPRYATDAASARVQEFVHRGLIRLDAHFNAVGDLAASWQQDSPLEWRFRLKSGIHFSNGALLQADDVVATMKAVLNPKLASPLAAGFAAIASVTAPNSHEVVIRLKKPDASLLTHLNLGILPASMASAPQRAHHTIGCGPYRLQSWNDSALTLSRADDFNTVQPGAAQPATTQTGATQTSGPVRIRFISVKDPVTRILKLQRGELDFVQNDLPPHLLSYIRAQPQLRMQTRPSTTFTYIGLNMQDRILKDLRVRRALALALDRNKLKKALYADLPELAETVLTPDHWASSPLPRAPFDPTAAAKLLDDAGFPRRADGMRFTITYRTSTDPTRLRIATAIAAMWQRIGVNTAIESLEWGGFYARIKRGDFQLFSLAWVGINDPDIYRWILHSSMWPPKGANRGRYANADVDSWLERAATADTQAERKQLYANIEKQMQRDMVYIPLWYDPVIAVSGPRLSGFKPAANGSLRGLMQATLSPKKMAR